MNLGVTVVASGNAVGCACCLDLLVLEASVIQTFLLVTGLQKTTTAAATIIIGTIRGHVDKIFFPDHGFDDKSEIFGNGVPIAFSDDLAGILDSELDLQVFVPVRVDLEFAFPDPFCIVLINIFDFKVMFDVEFFQSGPDCKGNVPSLGIEVCFAPQLVCLVRGDLDKMLP